MDQQKSSDILNDYQNGKKVSELSKETNLSSYKIRKILKSFGIELRKDKHFPTNPQLKTDFFKKIDSEEKAYILGLMYSDGSVSPYLNKKGQLGSYKIRIRLQVKDHEILKQISNIMCGSDITTIQKRKEKNWQDIASFQIGNIQLGRDLIKNGCPPNKSNIIRFPTEDIIPPYLLRHFIRGFFDGDGGVNSKLPIVIGFTSNQIMCEQISEFLTTCGFKVAKFVHRKNGYGTIHLFGQKNCSKFYQFLYDNSSICLNRKKQKLDELLKINASTLDS